MKRLIAQLLGAAVLICLVCLPALAWNVAGEADTSEDTTITSYGADFDLSSSGVVRVQETLAVSVGSGKHGIFRFWDRVDPSAPDVRREPEDVTVTRDGAEEPFDLSTEQHGRVTVAKIGSADSTLSPGVHTYVIDFTMKDAILPGTAAVAGLPSQFYWNLVPGGWLQPIDQATLTVHLPEPSPTAVSCAVGAGATTGCQVAGAGTDTLVVTAANLAPNTPVTLLTGLDQAPPALGDEVAWAPRWDRVLGTSLPLLLVLAVLGLLGGLAGAVLGARTREQTPGLGLQYAPPEGVGPAQAAYVLTEKIEREAYVATLMYAAERGAITLDRAEDAWTITDKAGASGWSGLDPVTTEVAHLLSGPGTSFTASKHDVESGKRLQTEISDFESDVEGWSKREKLMTSSALGPFGGLLVVVAAVLTLVIVFLNPFDVTALALVPGGFAVGGLALLLPGSSTRRTRSGRELWSRVGGFHRVLSTPSSKDRFDFSGRQELYTAYLPWAVAFGCADEWADKYTTEVGTEPPTPSWFPAYAGVGAAGHVTSMVHDFDSTVDGAISAYTATQQSSSSGSGGGFSGGGGGGGGGGGSW